jgi:hypothetical protein
VSAASLATAPRLLANFLLAVQAVNANSAEGNVNEESSGR